MKSTDTLQSKISEGVKARQELADYGGRLAKLQKHYLSELMMAVRKGENIEPAAYKLTALDDVRLDLDQAVSTGARAAQKLNDLQKESQE